MEMDSDSDIEIPRKRQRTKMFTNECIICGEHGLKELFCQPKDQELWTKLLEAASLKSFFNIKNTLVFQIFIIIQSAERHFVTRKRSQK